MIHHLDGPGASGYPMIRKFLSEAHRVLKPGGGTLVINTISPEQCTSPWYFAMLPQAHQVLSKKYIEREREDVINLFHLLCPGCQKFLFFKTLFLKLDLDWGRLWSCLTYSSNRSTGTTKKDLSEKTGGVQSGMCVCM